MTTGKDDVLRVLEVSGSARRADSVSRQLTAGIVDKLKAQAGTLDLVQRDLGNGIAFVDERWVEANFTLPEERSAGQHEILRGSDELVAELKRADIIVIGAPIYNFGVPATLKAWIDMIARARLTFRYTENGPVGLLQGKKAYIAIASGGVPVDSAVDFATPYLRQALKFVGIDDIEVVAADGVNLRGEEAVQAALRQIGDLFDTGQRAA